MSRVFLRILVVLMALAVFPAHAASGVDDWEETNGYDTFRTDRKRSMDIDRPVTFLPWETATRLPVQGSD